MWTTLLLAASPAHAQDALSEYASRRLVCWAETRYHSTTQFYDDGTVATDSGDYRVWGVKDGRGNPLDTSSFARMVGDDKYLGEVEANVEKAKHRSHTLTYAGLGVAAVGAGALFVGYSQGLFAASYGGGMVFAGGAGLAGYGLTSGMAAKAPLLDVTRAYEYGLAAQRCENHNSALRTELGLTPDDTKLLDTASLEMPERTQKFAVHPVIAPGAMGLVGTF